MRLQPLRMRRITRPMRMALRLRQIELSAKTVYGPVLKTAKLRQY